MDITSAVHAYQQDLDNLRRKDSLRGAETAKISVRLGNYSASHFEGSALHIPQVCAVVIAGDESVFANLERSAEP
jgi:hypothetical protein